MYKLGSFCCVLMIFLSVSSFAQSRAGYFDLQAEIIPPAEYNPETEYPLLIMLPYTTGTAAEFYNRYRGEIGTDRYIVLLPVGRPVRSDYLPNFMQYVDWYEERLLAEIERAERLYSVDPGRRILAGYSLGGDLSWALTMKQPEMFIGAVMAGTRCSYPPERSDLETLKRKGYRGAFFIGRNEDINRYDGINAARWTLDNAGIETQYTEIAGGHVAAPVELFTDALAWIMEGTGDGREDEWSIDEREDAAPVPDIDGTLDGTAGFTEGEAVSGGYTLRLINNSGVTITSVDLQRENTRQVVPLMGTYRGDAPLKTGEEISFELSRGDSVILEGEEWFTAESPIVSTDVLMILKPDGTFRVYK